MKTLNTTLFFPQVQRTSPKKNRKRDVKKKTENTATQLLTRLQPLLRGITAMFFTATIFLSGSYFFFIQLAEYGW